MLPPVVKVTCPLAPAARFELEDRMAVGAVELPMDILLAEFTALKVAAPAQFMAIFPEVLV